VKKNPLNFHLAKKKPAQTRGMSQENPISKQPLIRHVNRQQTSWRAVDVRREPFGHWLGVWI